MIRISVQTGGAEEIYGIDGAYKVIKEAGFDAVDVNLDHLYPGSLIRNGKRVAAFDCETDEECLEYFRPWKEAAEKYDKQTVKKTKTSVVSSERSEISDVNSEVVEFDALNMYIIHEVKKTNNVAYIIATSTDTWTSVAKEFGLKEQELRKFNEYPKQTQMAEGMKIYVQAKKNKVSNKPFVHTVDYNESMHDIAQKYGVKMLSIYKLNNKEKWSKVKVGEKLKLK